MTITRRSACKLPAENSVDSDVEEPLQQDLEQPSTVTEDVPRNKGPSIKIKFTLPKKDKPDKTVQQPEAPLNDGHSGSELQELVREQPHRSGM